MFSKGGGPPPLPFCHLCNRQFGTSSLPIHVKACTERWEREHGRPAPQPVVDMPSNAKPGSREWREFNEAAQAKFNSDTLQPCPHCGRTFLPDRLQVHLRSCGQGHFANGHKPRSSLAGGEEERQQPSPEGKLGLSARQRRDAPPPPSKPLKRDEDGGGGGGAASDRSSSAGRQRSASAGRQRVVPGGPPRLPSCHLCGRQFGTSSLAIHVKACREKWEREHPGQKAPESAVPMPDGLAPGSKEWAAYNAASWEQFQTDTLVPCPHCGRTFLPDRLPVHLRSCGKGHFADGHKPPPSRGCAATDDDDASTQPHIAFPSPKQSAAACKLGALARMHSSSSVGRAEAEAFFEQGQGCPRLPLSARDGL
jgi:ribosomal protein L32